MPKRRIYEFSIQTIIPARKVKIQTFGTNNLAEEEAESSGKMGTGHCLHQI